MNLLFVASASLFSIWILKNIFYWVWLWQLKEYRFDRLFVHLKDTSQGKKLLFSPFSIIKWLVLLGYITIAFNEKSLFSYQYIIFFVFLIQFIFILNDLKTGQIRRPVFTFKALLVTALSLGASVLLFTLPFIDPFPWILFIDRLIPIIIALFVLFFSFPTELFKDWKVEKAMKKMAQFKDVLVIGVTGSYGKSSTKDYIAQVLEKKFKVVKSPGTNNTPIGVSNTVLSKVNKDTQILVVEMSAYKKGEIMEIAQIVRPKIGVITAVSPQHLSLFKTIENTMRTKYELIESLPKDGIALFNGNNENAYKLFKKTKLKKVLYLTGNSKNSKESFIAGNIIVDKNFVTFDVVLNGEKVGFRAFFIGAHGVENVLPAIYIANNLGMKKEDIKKAVSLLKPMPKTMALKKIKNINIIDDTFNANPDAVLAALNYMKIYKKKKAIVLQPMIELGKSAKEEHQRVSKEISRYCDYLLLTNKNFYGSIEKGIKDREGKCILKVGKPKELSEFIIENLGEGDVVLFEGKEAALVLDNLSKS